MATNRRRTGTEKASLTGKSDLRLFFFALLFFVLLCVCARFKMDKVWKFGVLMVLRIVFFSSFGCRGLMLRLMGCWEGTGMSTRWTSRAAKASSSCSFQKGWVINPQILWLWVNLSSALFFWRGEVITSFFESEICDDCCCFQFKCKWHLFYYRLRHG